MFSLCTYEDDSGEHVGVVIDEAVVEVKEALRTAGCDPACGTNIGSMVDLLEHWDMLLPLVKAAVPLLRTAGVGEPLSDVTLLAPVPRPGVMINVGLNYTDHAEEMGITLPSADFRPSFFFKGGRHCVIGPDSPIGLSSDKVDWEAELAVVIGRRARHVPVEEACAYIAGYTCHNDVTDRGLMLRPDGTLDFLAGKARDTFAPLGPTLVPREFVPDVRSLRVRLLLDGVAMQDFGCAGLVWGPAECVSYLSSVMTLEPGDVVALGTGAGVGWAKGLPPGPRLFADVLAHFAAGGGVYMRRGDRVSVEIDGVGRLENTVA